MKKRDICKGFKAKSVETSDYYGSDHLVHIRETLWEEADENINGWEVFNELFIVFKFIVIINKLYNAL